MWAYRTVYKITYRLIFGKVCHFPIELQHKAFWAIKKFNLDLHQAGVTRMMHLNEIDENRMFSYENVEMYKSKVKK